MTWNILFIPSSRSTSSVVEITHFMSQSFFLHLHFSHTSLNNSRKRESNESDSFLYSNVREGKKDSGEYEKVFFVLFILVFFQMSFGNDGYKFCSPLTVIDGTRYLKQRKIPRP